MMITYEIFCRLKLLIQKCLTLEFEPTYQEFLEVHSAVCLIEHVRERAYKTSIIYNAMSALSLKIKSRS